MGSKSGEIKSTAGGSNETIELDYSWEEVDIMPEIPKNFLTVKDAAAACKVPRQTLHSWVARLPELGQTFQTSPICSKLYVDMDKLTAWDQRETKGD